MDWRFALRSLKTRAAPSFIASQVLLVGCAFGCGQSARVQLEPMHFRGVALAHVHRRGKGYGSGVSNRLLKRLRARGMNLIQLNPFGYQASQQERSISFADPTLTERDLRKEIRAVHALGLKVMLAPHLWLGQEETPHFWRSHLKYTDPHEAAEWFDAYGRFLLHYARIARDERVAVFAVGVELEQLTRHTDRFRALIRQVRALGYRGLLTYECEAWNVKNIKFWNDLDFIGLNFYYSFDREVREADGPEFQKLTEFLSQKLEEHYDFGARIGRPVVLTEFGYPGHHLATSKTSAWPSTMRKQDDEAQRTGFSAMRAAFRKAGKPHGIIFWKYVTTLDSYEKKNHATDFILEGKPAEVVMEDMLRLP